jgi:gas vesicle protein
VRRLFSMSLGIAVGAIAVYFLDPDRGERRREQAMKRLRKRGPKMVGNAQGAVRDAWKGARRAL